MTRKRYPFAIVALLLPLLCLAAPSAWPQEIHEAAASGDLATVNELLRANPGLIHTTDSSGYTVLQLAVQGGHREVVEALLAAGADVNAANDSTGVTAVDLAFQAECRGGSQLTKLLLDHGAEFDANGPARGRFNKLGFAVDAGNAEMVRFLLERGADVNAETRYPLSPLANASLGGKTEIVTLLLAAGADVDAGGSYGYEPILLAVLRGHADVVRALLAHGAAVDRVEAWSGRPLLHTAAVHGSVDIVTQLLERGAAVDDEDRSGRTPLDYANQYGHRQVANILVGRGASGRATLEPPLTARRLGEGEAVAWYLNHRGWAIMTANHFLVFDAEEFGVTRPTEPSLANGFITPREISGRDVVAIYSTYHGGPGEPAYIHEIEDSLPSITYVHPANVGWRGSRQAVYLSGRQDTTVAGTRISTIDVTGEMEWLGYLLRVDGLVIFYAGFRTGDLGTYQQELEHLAQRSATVDLAVLPVIGPREEDSDFKLFLERFHPKAVLVSGPPERRMLFGTVPERVRGWGFESVVFAPENPGDAFVYERR
ncbi:MAG: hypothetical protein GTN78_20895 [Gemmatimonadales bacterium]|nr:hypothetical protein [Gemmatimonadales bacterium]NIN12950.1 hypothetical protein [Gemmatimonadales bacterium]NIR02625.1 hypothetical protein [Gemmatimonadales bacterium]NIS67201.1 hypothetical protein [Gemmatimonadales bacterium]